LVDLQDEAHGGLSGPYDSKLGSRWVSPYSVDPNWQNPFW
jgi:hypothetical protein